MSVIKFARLQAPVAIDLIHKEFNSLQPGNWQPHMNRRHYAGEWNVLSLRSPGGIANPFADPIQGEDYADTAWMQQFPSVKQLSDFLPCEKMAIRLLNLRPGALIKEHTDKELCFEKGEARLHFPIFTNAFTEFILDNKALTMREGECWYINANLPHRLANRGDTDRIHLVIDCKVNKELQSLFENHCLYKEVISENELRERNKQKLEQTIQELRRQTSNRVALELADQLKRQLEADG